MSNLSRCIIELNKSTIYLRLSVIVYSFSAYMVLNSQLWWFIKSSLVFYLIITLISIYANPIPYSYVIKLFFSNNEWFLNNQFSDEIRYQKHKIILDCGLFFLLKLISYEKNKVLIIFSDQLTNNDYRALKLIEKIY
ncbi:protein YgfX [Legionella sp. D16C41]|uniref:protein YgfX n=1 Tax=Legionella sp. D16C41 TaxID=3402688 RepID=UPI003AF9B9D5